MSAAPLSESEAVVVGSALVHPTQAAPYLDELQPSLFRSREAAMVWQVIRDIRPVGGSAGLIRVEAKIMRREGRVGKEEATFLQRAWSAGHAHGLDLSRHVEILRGSAPQPKSERFKLLSLSDLESLRDPEWLTDERIPAGGLIVVYGPPGAGKSFFVLGLVLSVVYGIPFYGNPVKSGPVLYVAAEGHAGLKARVQAWRTANAVTDDAPAHFYPDVVNLLDIGAIGGLIAELKQLPEMPLLVVFDTFARCMPGGDENSARDVGLAIANADRVRKETGAAVLLVHHTNKSGESERGSTALRGAADTMISVKSDDGAVVVSCDKQKEAEAFAKLALRLHSVLESCILTTDTGSAQQSAGVVSQNEREALESLTSIYIGEGTSTSTWLKASKMHERAFYRAVKPLVEKGLVTQEKVGRSTLNTPTLRGQAAITDNCEITDKQLTVSRASITDTPPHSFRSGSGVSNAPDVSDELEGVFDAA